MVKSFALVGIVLVAVGAVAFFGGVKYQGSKTSQFPGFAGGPEGQGWRGQRSGSGRQAFAPVAGEIISQDADSITVKLQDGSSKIVLLSGSTTINKTDKASKLDLRKGEKVRVIGTENSDNSVTAQNIQLNPQVGRVPGEMPGQ